MKRHVRGSLTLEAAFVMPIILYSIFALIYLGFYLHDYCKIQGLVDRTLYKAGAVLQKGMDPESGALPYEQHREEGIFETITGSKERKETLYIYLERELSKGLFLSKVREITINTGYTTVSAIVLVETKVSLPGIQPLFRKLSKVEIKEEEILHNPAESIRKYEVILETASEIKGADQLKKTIEDILK